METIMIMCRSKNDLAALSAEALAAVAQEVRGVREQIVSYDLLVGEAMDARAMESNLLYKLSEFSDEALAALALPSERLAAITALRATRSPVPPTVVGL